METRTNELIESLSDLDSRDEIDFEVQQSFEGLSESLRQRGYEFEDTTGNFIGGQKILSRDMSDYNYYNEVNFINNGLNGSWIAVMDDYRNFKEIEDSVNDLIIKFE